jgi:hypothetical protein
VPRQGWRALFSRVMRVENRCIRNLLPTERAPKVHSNKVTIAVPRSHNRLARRFLDGRAESCLTVVNGTARSMYVGHPCFERPNPKHPPLQLHATNLATIAGKTVSVPSLQNALPTVKRQEGNNAAVMTVSAERHPCSHTPFDKRTDTHPGLDTACRVCKNNQVIPSNIVEMAMLVPA